MGTLSNRVSAYHTSASREIVQSTPTGFIYARNFRNPKPAQVTQIHHNTPLSRLSNGRLKVRKGTPESANGHRTDTGWHYGRITGALKRSGPPKRKNRLRSYARPQRNKWMNHVGKKRRGRLHAWSIVTREAIRLVDELCALRFPGICTGRAVVGHHRKLKSQGGTDTLDNCIPCCHACHRAVHHSIAASVAAGAIESRKGVQQQ